MRNCGELASGTAGQGRSQSPIDPMEGAEPGEGAVRLGLGQLRLGEQQIGEAEQQRQSVVVLGQAAVAHLFIAEAPFDEEEGVLDLGPQRSPLSLALSEWTVRRELPAAAGTHRDPPLDLRVRLFGTPPVQARGRLLRVLVAGVTSGLALVSVQQPMRLRHVGRIRRRRAQAVGQAQCRVHADVQFHPESATRCPCGSGASPGRARGPGSWSRTAPQ